MKGGIGASTASSVNSFTDYPCVRPISSSSCLALGDPLAHAACAVGIVALQVLLPAFGVEYAKVNI